MQAAQARTRNIGALQSEDSKWHWTTQTEGSVPNAEMFRTGNPSEYWREEHGRRGQECPRHTIVEVIVLSWKE
jgi:hypothetical protein